MFEAGTRVPFIAYWNGKILPTTNDAIISQIDLLASIAKLVKSDERGRDSKDLLSVLMGKSEQGRDELVLEATSRTAFRKGDWVMIPPYKGPAVNKSVNIELGNSSEYQLYNIKDDIGEQNNLASSEKEKLEEMIKAFEEIRGAGYTETEALELK